MKRKLMAIFLCGMVSYTMGQDAIQKELQQIQGAFAKKEFLSYNARYFYAYEKTPAIYIDSVHGSYKMSNANMWVQLDDVEYIQNDSMLIAVYPQDQTILLNSSSPQWMQLILNWDSLWNSQKEIITATLEKTDNINTVILNYIKDSNYKRIEIWYHPKTYLPEKLIYVLRQPQLPGDDETEEQADPFAIIEVRLSGYSTSPFNKDIFSTARYVVQTNNEYVPAERFTGYTILSGIPKRIN